jgi:predicted DNA-binding protein YlxM (UPF0122 family)
MHLLVSTGINSENIEMAKREDLGKKTLIVLYVHNKMSLSEIAKFVNCSNQTVLNWMRIHDIPRRSYRESMLGREHTWGDKIGEKNKGHKHSNETKDKISKAQWETGICGYRKFKKDKCERCQSTKYLIVHHKDENRKNNIISNLETLCRSCHQAHHGVILRCRRKNLSA